VLDDEHRPVGRVVVRELADEPGDDHPLADVEVRRDLVEEVEVRVAGETRRDGDALELAAGDGVDVLVHHRTDVEAVDEVVERAALVGALQQFAGVAVELVRDLVDVLRLSRDRHVAVLQRFEVVLEPGTAEAVEDALPVAVGGVVAEVRDHLAGERVDGRRLPDPVRPEDAGDAARLGGREAVQRERVVAVAVDRVVVELGGDLDGVERTRVDADAAALAQTDLLGDVDLVRVALLGVLAALGDTLLARPVGRAVLHTLVVTAVGLAPIEVHDRDTVVGHLRPPVRRRTSGGRCS